MNLCFATQEEKSKPLPGDQIVDAPAIASTHSITIDATASDIWPWLVQLGQNRGGFYSYTLLENLLGCRMRNAETINPEWQVLSEGDAVSVHPKCRPLRVARIERNHFLVLVTEASFAWTWVFVLIPSSETGCRLLVRSRLSSDRRFLKLLLYPVMTIGHYVMERGMLVGIKRRSERSRN